MVLGGTPEGYQASFNQRFKDDKKNEDENSVVFYKSGRSDYLIVTEYRTDSEDRGYRPDSVDVSIFQTKDLDVKEFQRLKRQDKYDVEQVSSEQLVQRVSNMDREDLAENMEDHAGEPRYNEGGSWKVNVGGDQ